MKIKSAKIIVCLVLIKLLFMQELLFPAMYLAPPWMNTVLNEFEILTPEEKAFFEEERSFCSHVSETVIRVNKKDTEKDVVARIIALLRDNQTYKKQLNILVFVQLSFVEAPDKSGHALREAIGFNEKYKGNYCIPDFYRLCRLQGQMIKNEKGEVDFNNPDKNLILSMITLKNYLENLKEIEKIKQLEALYREAVKNERLKKFEQAKKGFFSFWQAYSTDMNPKTKNLAYKMWSDHVEKIKKLQAVEKVTAAPVDKNEKASEAVLTCN